MNNGFLYSKGVQNYRERMNTESKEKDTTANNNVSNNHHVLVRARPLFQHEVDLGEWDSITSNKKNIVVHESDEKLKSHLGMIKILRHHTFYTPSVNTDDELYQSIRNLLDNSFILGNKSTLFCYGMTGSGKTYSMNSIQNRLPYDLFPSGSRSEKGDATIVQFSAYELLGKICVDMLPINVMNNS